MSFLLGSHKRDLSNGPKSRNGEDSKKIREDYDNIDSMPRDVFADGLMCPGCENIISNCLKNIERQVNELYTLYEDKKTHKIKAKSNYNL